MDDKIILKNGVVLTDGKLIRGDKQIGIAVRDLKYGYHPAIKVVVGVNTRWFETDETNLYSKIGDFVDSAIKKKIRFT